MNNYGNNIINLKKRCKGHYEHNIDVVQYVWHKKQWGFKNE